MPIFVLVGCIVPDKQTILRKFYDLQLIPLASFICIILKMGQI